MNHLNQAIKALEAQRTEWKVEIRRLQREMDRMVSPHDLEKEVSEEEWDRLEAEYNKEHGEMEESQIELEGKLEALSGEIKSLKDLEKGIY